MTVYSYDKNLWMWRWEYHILVKSASSIAYNSSRLWLDISMNNYILSDERLGFDITWHEDLFQTKLEIWFPRFSNWNYNVEDKIIFLSEWEFTLGTDECKQIRQKASTFRVLKCVRKKGTKNVIS